MPRWWFTNRQRERDVSFSSWTRDIISCVCCSWCITFPSMHLESVTVSVCTDGSFNSLPNGHSQGGQIVFLVDRDGLSCPIAWNSTKLRRVVRSALAAETRRSVMDVNWRIICLNWFARSAQHCGDLFKGLLTVSHYLKRWGPRHK